MNSRSGCVSLMKKKENPEVQEWENSFLRMDDSHFFDIIHAYFGAVETPFNKHKLLEQLISFFKQSDVQHRIINALSYLDIQILTAILYLKVGSASTVANYLFEFEGEEIEAKLENLYERLLIYPVPIDHSPSGDVCFSLNPVLKDCLLPYLNFPFLMPYKFKQDGEYYVPYLTPVFFSFLYSYLFNYRDVFKKDGSLKKKVLTNFFDICPILKGKPLIIEKIIDCLLRLKLIVRVENEIEIVEEEWRRFATLSHVERVVYLCVASTAYEYICKYNLNIADMLNEFLHIFKVGHWYDKNDVYRTFFLVYKRFFAIHSVRAEKSDSLFYGDDESMWQSNVVSINILHLAVDFGLLLKRGDCFAINDYFLNVEEEDSPLLISNTFEATLTQNASFLKLLPLLPALKPSSLHTFASFEFNRVTCEKLFEKEMNDKDVLSLLENVVFQPVPQNVQMAVEGWMQSYSSISLHYGYVLTVDEKKRKIFSKDLSLSALIKKEIAPGVYLLNAKNPKSINSVLKKAGLDFIFFNNESSPRESNFVYPALKKVWQCEDAKPDEIIKKETEEREKRRERDELELLKKLKTASFNKDEERLLKDRIKRCVVLIENQVSSDAVNAQVRIAVGRDFLGKVKLLEEAKERKLKVEVTLITEKTISGLVYNMWKTFNKTKYMVEVIERFEERYDVHTIDVSQILKIKIIATSIFS